MDGIVFEWDARKVRINLRKDRGEHVRLISARAATKHERHSYGGNALS